MEATLIIITVIWTCKTDQLKFTDEQRFSFLIALFSDHNVFTERQHEWWIKTLLCESWSCLCTLILRMVFNSWQRCGTYISHSSFFELCITEEKKKNLMITLKMKSKEDWPSTNMHDSLAGNECDGGLWQTDVIIFHNHLFLSRGVPEMFPWIWHYSTLL